MSCDEGEKIVSGMTEFLGIPLFSEQEMVNIRVNYFARKVNHNRVTNHTPNEILEIESKANMAGLRSIFDT